MSGNLLKLERVLQLNSHQLEEGHVTVSLQYKEEKGDGTAAAPTAAAVGDNDEEDAEEEEEEEEKEKKRERKEDALLRSARCRSPAIILKFVRPWRAIAEMRCSRSSRFHVGKPAAMRRARSSASGSVSKSDIICARVVSPDACTLLISNWSSSFESSSSS